MYIFGVWMYVCECIKCLHGSGDRQSLVSIIELCENLIAQHILKWGIDKNVLLIFGNHIRDTNILKSNNGKCGIVCHRFGL